MVRLYVLLALGACASGPPIAPPSGPPPASLVFLGDYYGTTDTIYVREQAGRLEAVIARVPRVLQPRGSVDPARPSTFMYDRDSLVLESGQAIHDGKVLHKRSYAGGTFRISPMQPVAELRAIAAAATPPAQPDSLLQADLVELAALDPTIKYDIRYATSNNFMGAVFYSSAHAFLQRPAAQAVVRAHRRLKALGYGLLIHDAYRPWYVTKMFWDATPDSLRHFVADPRAGSRHNRGAAVDLTLYELATGNVVEMPGGYDEFSERSYPHYPGGTTRQRWHRDLLRRIMEEEGFRVYDFEWWHFDYSDWRKYRVGNLTFEQLTTRE